MLNVETVKTIFLVILGLCLLSFVVSFLKRESYNVRRAIIIAVIFGGLYLFIQQSGLQKISFQTIRDRYFPAKLKNFEYTKTTSLINGFPSTTYAFKSTSYPPLRVSMSSDGKRTEISDISLLNQVLDYLGLPPVTTGTPELSSITGNSIDADLFRWDDYTGGTLLVRRIYYQDRASLSTKPCIVNIIVIAKK